MWITKGLWARPQKAQCREDGIPHEPQWLADRRSDSAQGAAWGDSFSHVDKLGVSILLGRALVESFPAA